MCYGHGLDQCGRLTGNDLTLFRCDVALLRGLSAASCQSKYQRGGARQGNESRHICLLLVSAGHARNSETLPSLPKAITSNASKIGRATCRERVCQSGSISVVAVPSKKKHSLPT